MAMCFDTFLKSIYINTYKLGSKQSNRYKRYKRKYDIKENMNDKMKNGEEEELEHKNNSLIQ